MAKVQQPSGGRLISKEEVAKHNKQSDLWLIIHGKVYDVSKFVEEHPGGVDVINDGAGEMREICRSHFSTVLRAAISVSHVCN